MAQPASSALAFRHEAAFYAGIDGFVATTAPFVAEAVEADEPVLVVVSAAKIDLLRQALDGRADRVHFADMADVGHNPARIIPAWREFVNDHGAPDRRLRGIGEPISADRSDDAMAECHRHESLLNLAFAECGGFWLRCPYDVTALVPAVIEEAERNHPHLFRDGVEHTSPLARDLAAIAAPFDDPLPEPPAMARELVFDHTSLTAVRGLVRALAEQVGLPELPTADLVLAVNEIATNSIRHAGGAGVALGWTVDATVVCEIRDSGQIVEPLVGRARPVVDQSDGRGMWLANQLCDLVQVRSSAAGTIVRLQLARR